MNQALLYRAGVPDLVFRLSTEHVDKYVGKFVNNP